MNNQIDENTDDIEETQDDTVEQGPMLPDALAQLTLTGDTRDFLVDFLKNVQEPWEKLSEFDQQGQINRATDAAERLIERIVHIVAAGGNEIVRAELEQFTVKNGIKLTITCLNTEDNILSVSHMAGRRILLVNADDQMYYGERHANVADPDQREMPIAKQAPGEERVVADVYSLGWSAAGAGDPVNFNPYEEGSDDHNNWSKGWNDQVNLVAREAENARGEDDRAQEDAEEEPEPEPVGQ